MRAAAIAVGWSEGPWQSKAFRKALSESGFQITNVAKADIVVAHSAGCFWLPSDLTAKLVVLIGPNFWPKRSYLTSVKLNTSDGLRHHKANGSVTWWANKLLHNAWYVVTRPQLTFRLFRRFSHDKLPAAKDFQKIILIRNKRDAFCHPDVKNLIKQAKDYKYIEFDGDHEDCWLNPGPYVELIKKELE